MHPRTVGVENPGNLDLDAVLTMIVKEQGLGAPLAFVIARARADRIDISPIILGLRMHRRIAVDFTGRGLQYLATEPFGQAQNIDCAVNGCLGCLHRIVLIMHRRRGAGEVVNLIHLNKERYRHIVPHQLKTRIVEQMADIVLGAREEVVDAQHVTARLNQPVAKVRSEKSSTTGYQHGLVHWLPSTQKAV